MMLQLPTVAVNKVSVLCVGSVFRGCAAVLHTLLHGLYSGQRAGHHRRLLHGERTGGHVPPLHVLRARFRR